MRFTLVTALLAALATTGAADRMSVNTKCPCSWCGSCDHRDATFYTDFGAYKVNAGDGCRGTKVPQMEQLCVDWGKGRAHFKFKGQNKRCLLQRSKTAYSCSAHQCYSTEWEPTKCTW